MSDRWRSWVDETAERRLYFVSALVVVVAVAVTMIVGTFGGGGLTDPALWIGLALVPVLLWLVKRAGLP